MRYWLLLFFTMTPGYVFAYIDPGTGSLIIQGLLAAFAGAIVAIKLYWYKFKSLFKRNNSEKDSENQDGNVN